MSNSSVVKVIDIRPDEYTSGLQEFFAYEIKDSNLTLKDVRDAEKFKRQTAALKRLPVGKMFVVDRDSHGASKWASRWGKMLNRRFATRKLTNKLTEIHRVE